MIPFGSQPLTLLAISLVRKLELLDLRLARVYMTPSPPSSSSSSDAKFGWEGIRYLTKTGRGLVFFEEGGDLGGVIGNEESLVSDDVEESVRLLDFESLLDLLRVGDPGVDLGGVIGVL